MTVFTRMLVICTILAASPTMASNQVFILKDSTGLLKYDAANKMTSPGTFTYDDKGNMLTHAVSSITTTYTWDYLNRMTEWQKTGETTQTYVYNADGMRVRVTPSGGTATNFLLDSDQIAEEVTGGSVTSYVGLGLSLVSKIVGITHSVCHPDGIGSTRAMSDANQAVTEVVVYSAYGSIEVEYGTPSTPGFGFAGQYRYYTDATGLDYLQARYYHSSDGRFVSRDPIGYAGGLNLYGYAYANPVMRVDPTGTIAPWIAAWITKLAIGCGVGATGGGGPELVEALIDWIQGDPIAGGLAGVACRAGIQGLCGCILGAASQIPWVGDTLRSAILGALGGGGCSALANDICPCN